MNEQGFTRVMETYQDDVFRIALNYLKCSASADDVVQDVFIKYYESDKRFESEAHLKNWLIRVAINCCKKHLVSSWVKRTVPIETYLDCLSFDSSAEKELLSLVLSLPKKYRMVIHLYYYEGYQAKEIAALLGISETAVQTQLARGRNQLKQLLTQP